MDVATAEGIAAIYQLGLFSTNYLYFLLNETLYIIDNDGD